MRTILVQGAVQEEIEQLINNLPGGNWTEQKGYAFYEASFQKISIIISKTEIGIMHACISTILGIGRYQPDCIINQGTAGGHTRDLEIGDIVIGESAIYINNMRTPIKARGQGSNALEWFPWKSGSFLLQADPRLVELAEKTPYDGKLLRGKLGSGDLFSRETDRIDLLHTQFGELCEDMESAAVYKVCQTFHVPVIGIRIISNNEITGKHDDPEQFQIAHQKLQNYIYQYIGKLTDSIGVSDTPNNHK